VLFSASRLLVCALAHFLLLAFVARFPWFAPTVPTPTHDCVWVRGTGSQRVRVAIQQTVSCGVVVQKCGPGRVVSHFFSFGGVAIIIPFTVHLGLQALWDSIADDRRGWWWQCCCHRRGGSSYVCSHSTRRKKDKCCTFVGLGRVGGGECITVASMWLICHTFPQRPYFADHCLYQRPGKRGNHQKREGSLADKATARDAPKKCFVPSFVLAPLQLPFWVAVMGWWRQQLALTNALPTLLRSLSFHRYPLLVHYGWAAESAG
jgi:hypothetical protein